MDGVATGPSELTMREMAKGQEGLDPSPLGEKHCSTVVNPTAQIIYFLSKRMPRHNYQFYKRFNTWGKPKVTVTVTEFHSYKIVTSGALK